MLIEGFRLISYGPFADSGDLNLLPGMNLIVGQNNSGKSAVLKSFSVEPVDSPHRNLERYREIDLLPSKQRLKVRVSGAEYRDAFMERGGELYFPLPEALRETTPETFLAAYFTNANDYLFDFYRVNGGYSKAEAGPSHGGFNSGSQWSVLIRSQKPSLQISRVSNQGEDGALDLMPHLLTRNMFRFDAERLSIARCAQSDATILAPNAANLPAILQRMRGRQPALFQKLEARVREILPSVYGITTTPVNQTEVEIIVWPTAEMENPEHGFSLNESGTGVAQVLAILTAVMTRENAVIVIDEINSFLHPAAVKALIRILNSEFSGHQYIISTHSAEVIASSNPSTLHVVKRTGFDSTCKAVQANDVEELRNLSDLLGISIGDIFAADRVLWVEGRTEELCFPYLMNLWGLDYPRGLIVSPVVATGDFQGKRDFQLVLSIYARLTRVTLPLVRSVTFSFDAEDLTPNERNDLTRQSRGRVVFLPRRHLECYLVNPSAIATFINARDLEAQPILADQVAEELASRGGEAKYRAKAVWSGKIDDDRWLTEVDAANLIADVVASLSEHRVSFKKTVDTLALLELVAASHPEALVGLRSYVENLLALVQAD